MKNTSDLKIVNYDKQEVKIGQTSSSYLKMIWDLKEAKEASNISSSIKRYPSKQYSDRKTSWSNLNEQKIHINESVVIDSGVDKLCRKGVIVKVNQRACQILSNIFLRSKPDGTQ